MPVQYKIPEQVLAVTDTAAAAEDVVRQYDAFLNLLSSDAYSFQRDAIRAALRFLVSPKYPTLEVLARENWTKNPQIRERHEGEIDRFLDRMPLRSKKAVSIDLATGTGKSYVMYGLAAVALAEGLVDRVLVLCPSLTIEDGLLGKFTELAGNGNMSAIMKELGAVQFVPGVKRGSETIGVGDICVENIHAVYARTGSSIRDSFAGNGPRTLVLNDEAHHLFGPADKALKEWLKFLLDDTFGFKFVVNVTGTPYVEDDYFPDIVFRFGLKQAIEAGIVKRPDYKIEDTHEAHDWEKTWAIHRRNKEMHGARLRPLTIIVTQEIARCVEVWRELVRFLGRKEGIPEPEAARRAIWVTSSVPTEDAGKVAGEASFLPLVDGDTLGKQRERNLTALKSVDSASSPVEWIVSVSMLTEGWDVKNVFQIVPHDSRAFKSKLLIAQVLGRGLRVPPGFSLPPLVTINNHEAWQDEIGKLLQDVLEVENTLSWGPDARRTKYLFPLHNLDYETVQTTVEEKRAAAGPPKVTLNAQERRTRETAKFSESGTVEWTYDVPDIVELEDAVKRLRLFFREKKDKGISKTWTKDRIREFVTRALNDAGQDPTFLTRENFERIQQAFGPMFRATNTKHPRLGQRPTAIRQVDMAQAPRQSLSESALKATAHVWYVEDDPAPFEGQEGVLWARYGRLTSMVREFGEDASQEARAIAAHVHPVPNVQFKSPWNVHVSSHEPERVFSAMLFDNAVLFDAFVKMPDRGGYDLPYSFKPSGIGRTHVKNERFNPDFFLRSLGSSDVLVVEIKADGDDDNRNKAKLRDGRRHFETLNERVAEAKDATQYHFYFLSPADYTKFFERLRSRTYSGWKSTLMIELET